MPRKESIFPDQPDGKRKRQAPERLKSKSLGATSRQDIKKKRSSEESASVHGSSFFSPPSIKYSEADLEHLGIQNYNAEDYIPSSLDNTGLVIVQPVALLTPTQGQGLFAREEIPKGTCIGIYTGIVYTEEEFERHLRENPGADKNYAMKLGDKWVDAAQKGNFTRYMNFSDTQPNVAFDKGKSNHQSVVKVVALKTIPKGQQILVNYNTYEPNASKHYFFMNPDDGALDSYAVYESHKDHYKMRTIRNAMHPLRLLPSQKIMLTKVAECILAKVSLFILPNQFDPAEADLPCFLVDTDNTLFNFEQRDVITPLMMACYLGQLVNVTWLIINHANIDRQQNHSGNCPLFFALAGYSGAVDKSSYFEVITLLIDNNVNVTVYDRDDNTFLHKALSVLSVPDFATVVTQLKNRNEKEFKALFDYVDNNDEDIVLHCLRMKDFDKFSILMDAKPDYFSEQLAPNQEEDIVLFTKLIEGYSELDKQYLIGILQEKGIVVHQSLLDQISGESDLDSGSSVRP